MLTFIAIAFAATFVLVVPVVWSATNSAAARLQRTHELAARQKFADLFIFIEPAQLTRLSALAMSLVLLLSWALGVPLLLALLLSITTLLAPRIAWRRFRTLRHARLTTQLPDAMGLLSGALRSGQGLAQAIAQLSDHQPAPIAQEFALLARKQRLGIPFDRALSELGERVPTADYALFTTAIRVARDLGGNLGEALERLADALRRRLTMEAKIRSLTSQGILQGWIVGLLPLLLFVTLLAMESQVMREMFLRPLGWCALSVILLLEAAGFFLIRRIVRIDV